MGRIGSGNRLGNREQSRHGDTAATAGVYDADSLTAVPVNMEGQIRQNIYLYPIVQSLKYHYTSTLCWKKNQ